MTKEHQSFHKINYLSISLLIMGVALVCQTQTLHVTAYECGTKDVTRPLIKGGDQTLRGEWPFIAALYHIEQSKYFCEGTLISTKHILTAAHCIQGKYWPKKLSHDDIEVRVGAYNLMLKREEGTVHRYVTEIYVHPDWNVYDDRYDADIAILLLNDNVNYTKFIRLVCIPSDEIVVDGDTIDVEGYIVGWGLAENEIHEAIPRQALTRTLNHSHCYRTDIGTVRISSERTFCGGDGVRVPNKGDSGGGFFVFSGTAWTQYGIISAIRTNATGHVTTNSIAVYTNVKMFKGWIGKIVKQSGDVFGEANAIEINLKCRFDVQIELEKEIYGCWIHDLDIHNDIPAGNIKFASVIGTHKMRKSDQDVQWVVFENGTMLQLPDGIGKLFTNLENVKIASSLNTKFIRRSNFENLESLTVLRIVGNEIDGINEDLLWYLSHLESFAFVGNKLKMLSEKTFERNLNLKEINLHDNQLEVLPANSFKNNVLLEKVNVCKNSLKMIDGNTFGNNLKLTKVVLCYNQLEFLPDNVFKNNILLESISLQGNVLMIMSERIFANNAQLSYVSLFDNKLELLPANLFQNNLELETVRLAYNSLKFLDESTFIKNIKLTELSLLANQLELLHKNLFQKNVLLPIVSLTLNSLKTIDGSTFANNSRLTDVYITSNQLEFLPANLFQNNSLLEIVSLGNNSLKTIDEKTFRNNLKLKEIELYTNKLQFLPKNLFQNNLFLEVVQLGDNLLNSIDEMIFVNNTVLREANLNSNKFEVLPKNLFQKNLFLEKISLHNNSLKTIDAMTFINNSRLRSVDISSNQLEMLHENLFQNNFLLESVKIHTNLLKVIGRKMFVNNLKIINVYLNSNQLEFLPADLFENNLFLEYISLSENSLQIIEINFTNLKNIKKIWLYNNPCINGYYEDTETLHPNGCRNLSEFQGTIRANCSSVRP